MEAHCRRIPSFLSAPSSGSAFDCWEKDTKHEVADMISEVSMGRGGCLDERGLISMRRQREYTSLPRYP